jgi:hypothetical protein
MVPLLLSNSDYKLYRLPPGPQCESWVLTAPLRQRLNTFHNRCVRAMARPQRTSFSSTYDHPAPFVKRPALAPMYTALGLTSLDQVISNRKLRWAGHVKRMDWSRLPRKFLTSWVDAPLCRGWAHSYGHDLTRVIRLRYGITLRAMGVAVTSYGCAESGPESGSGYTRPSGGAAAPARRRRARGAHTAQQGQASDGESRQGV